MDMEYLLKHVTVDEQNTGNSLMRRAIAMGADHEKAIGAVYRAGYRQSIKDRKEQTLERKRRQETAALLEPILIEEDASNE